MATTWRGQYYKYREFSLSLLAIYKRRPDIKAFLEVILSLTTLIVFILFALKPTILTMITLYNDIQEKKATLAALNQKIDNLQTANNVFIQNQSAIPEIDSLIFTNPQPQIISKQMLGLAEKNSVTIQGVSIGQTVLIGKGTAPNSSASLTPLPESAKTMPLSVSLKGTYTNLIAFAGDLENLKIPVKIDSVAFNSTQLETGSILVELITARVPFIDSAVPAGNSSGPGSQ